MMLSGGDGETRRGGFDAPPGMVTLLPPSPLEIFKEMAELSAPAVSDYLPPGLGPGRGCSGWGLGSCGCACVVGINIGGDDGMMG
jgi:hypothetical protein